MPTMNEKKCPAIKTIRIDTATFQDSPATIEPTVINFFYGENGTGKSTIARSIGSPDHLEWADSVTPEDYEILIYNREFVSEEVSNYKQLHGIYTICKGNKEKEEQIAALEKKLDDAKNKVQAAEKTAREKEDKKSALLPNLKEIIWEKTKPQRKDFDTIDLKIKKKDSFYNAMSDKELAVESHDIEVLKTTAATAFGKAKSKLEKFHRAPEQFPAVIDEHLHLLAESITSSSESQFAQFLTALGAVDWVKDGHHHFSQKANGKCPYCQQPLPDDFEQQLASVFDEQYKEKTRQLSLLQNTYLSFADNALQLLASNKSKPLPQSLGWDAYDGLLEKLQDGIELNQERLDEKLKTPAQPASELKPILPIIRELNQLVEDFNKEIDAYNAIIDDQKNQQAKCKRQILEYLKSLVADDLSAYGKNLKNAEKACAAASKELTALQKEKASIESKIASLSKEIVSTVDVMNQINDTLRYTGFQGFRLRESKTYTNHYEIVRPDGSIAENLSEGELQFIAFLYFYHQVRGNREDGPQKKKIVVIDDPVSSMDDGVLFIVSSLIREFLEVCHSTADYHDPQDSGGYIKQIFILTHNIRFHMEITDQWVQDFTRINFYKVLKDGNQSSVYPCTKQDPASSLPKTINYNPVQNSYQALWAQLQEAKSTISVIHAIRQILDYYFIQMCSYDRKGLRAEVLGKLKKPAPEGGRPDTTQYHPAEALLRYIAAPNDFGHDAHYVDDATDAQPYREAFRLIFKAMSQEQHYQKMMETSRAACGSQETTTA